MTHSVHTLELATGVTLRYQSWRPEVKLRGVMFVVHGLAEHGGRYEDFALQMNRSGFAVATIDLPGHGHSSGSRCCVTHFSEYVDSVHAGCAQAEQEFAAETTRAQAEPADEAPFPFYLVGHSMGGLIASLYVRQYGERFAGVVFSGAALVADPAPPKLQLFIIKTLAKLFPRAGVLKLDAQGVSRDPVVVDTYLNDPLVYTDKLPACLLAAMFDAMDQAVEGLSHVSLPMLVLHGEADSIVPVKAAHVLMDRTCSADKELRVFPGLFHEIFNEPEREEIVDIVVQWANNRTSSG